MGTLELVGGDEWADGQLGQRDRRDERLVRKRRVVSHTR
jgi:hypothetical protein